MFDFRSHNLQLLVLEKPFLPMQQLIFWMTSNAASTLLFPDNLSARSATSYNNEGVLVEHRPTNVHLNIFTGI